MYRKFVLLSLLLILGTMASGIYVRATGAGLACPDAPACFGRWWPPENLTADMMQSFPGVIYDALAARLQMVHRLMALTCGLVLLGLWVGAWWQAKRRVALTGSTSLLCLTLLQGGLAAGLIHAHLMPLLVTAHWMVAALLAVGTWLWYLHLSPHDWVAYHHTSGLQRFAVLAWWVAFLQALLGVWVGTNYAALACPDFPTCQGQWLPPNDWSGFDLSRFLPAGDLSQWALPSNEARMMLHWLHRVGALITFVTLFGLGMGISSNPKVPHLSKGGVWLNFLLLVVIALGLSVVIKGDPAGLVVAHGMTAVVIILTVSGIGFFLRRGPVVKLREVSAAEPPLPSAPVPMTPEEEAVAPAPESLSARLAHRLGKTRSGLTGFLSSLPLVGRTLDDNLVEEIETHLLMADVGVDATQEIIARLTEKLRHHQIRASDEVMRALHDTLLEILRPCSQPLEIDPQHKPFVILVVGVNGVGKTTTIGKLAKRLQNQGHSVMLAAGDTFRAAAVEQLKVWGERNNVPVVAQDTGADSASVVFDALQAAQARGIDVLIADTAGRLHTKSNLMEELAKIKRIMAKIDPTAPHEVLLVLDSTTGQNALSQTEQFHQAVGDRHGVDQTGWDCQRGSDFCACQAFWHSDSFHRDW